MILGVGVGVAGIGEAVCIDSSTGSGSSAQANPAKILRIKAPQNRTAKIDEKILELFMFRQESLGVFII